MKLAIFAAAAVIAVTSAHAEKRVYPRHCTQSDLFPPGMSCKKTYDRGTVCESRDRTVGIGENTGAQSRHDESPRCTIETFHKINPPCVVDPAPNESTCGGEARMAVAKRHGFDDMAHASMSEAIEASEHLRRESHKVYKACMARNNYCVYRD